MPRRLGPDEAALWARVTGAVRPLKGRPRVVVKPSPQATPPAPAPPAPPKLSARALAQPVDVASLDGGWDRRLTRGRLVPDRMIDLHGCSRDQAYGLLMQAIEAAARHGERVLLVVTGKGGRVIPTQNLEDERPRGVIRASLPHWLETPALRPYIAALRPAHPRHGGAGAWYVILRRRR